ncbi:hypothetical protein AC578_2927 [Pseudocercospora eumusae]|uniref:Cell wall protein n=1 Tax=Pseudocercospora eumusae TaxID=321146 RepID=A0A139HEE6_9PEZI|nr:hypothetical protein AC578_2927 [Pseudocercospora eumusae]
MKISLLCFAFGALAATIETRDAATIAKDVQAVTDAVKDFETAITSFSGEADAEKVKSKLDAVHSALANRPTDAKASGDIPQDAALTLMSPVQDLANAVQQALTDLSGKKTALVSAGIAQDVYKKLNESDTAQQDFASTVLKKVPPTLAPVATGIIKPAQDKLARAITEFKGAGGTSSEGSSDSSSPAPVPAMEGDKGSTSAPGKHPMSVGQSSTGADVVDSGDCDDSTVKPPNRIRRSTSNIFERGTGSISPKPRGK